MAGNILVLLLACWIEVSAEEYKSHFVHSNHHFSPDESARSAKWKCGIDGIWRETADATNFTYCVDSILPHASIVTTYAATCCEAIITLQGILFPRADEILRYNLKKIGFQFKS
jgi:hypothetical protein